MRIRETTHDDAVAVDALCGRSFPALLAAWYEPDVLARALPIMTKPSRDLLASGTYYVAEEAGQIFGCGGWSFGEPRSGKIVDGLAHVRHFAVDPSKVRQSVGRRIFEHCARKALAQGATHFQAFAALNAEQFYTRMGLRRENLIEISMPDDVTIPAILMKGDIRAMLP